MTGVAYEGASIRVVLVDGAEIVEVVERRDAVGAPVWRRVDTSAGLRVITGWKALAVAAGKTPSQWRMLYRASRRSIRPLAVQYNAFDEPWTYECVIRDWLTLGNRPAWAYDLEQQRSQPASRCTQVHRQPKSAAQRSQNQSLRGSTKHVTSPAWRGTVRAS